MQALLNMTSEIGFIWGQTLTDLLFFFAGGFIFTLLCMYFGGKIFLQTVRDPKLGDIAALRISRNEVRINPRNWVEVIVLCVIFKKMKRNKSLNHSIYWHYQNQKIYKWTSALIILLLIIFLLAIIFVS